MYWIWKQVNLYQQERRLLSGDDRERFKIIIENLWPPFLLP